MHRSLAPESWTVEPATPAPFAMAAVPARVPGCVHVDLLRAGLIEHPNHGFAEENGRWIGRTDWRYRCVFTVDAAELGFERVDLVCAGLDTIATVALNGRAVGAAANMHHPHRFDVRDVLRDGANELTVTFRGPLAWAEECEARYGARPVNGDWGPYAYVRKAACHFGWDWGPCAPTAGICRDIALHGWSRARLGTVRVLVREANTRRAVVDVIAPIVCADPAKDEPVTVRVTLSRGNEIVEAETRTTAEGDAAVRLEIPSPALWWPRELGPQPLYDLAVALEAGGSRDRWTGRTGLRECRLNTAADGDGSAFAFEINGRAVFAKGANWIPDGLFAGERDAAGTRQLVERAAAANMNMLRVWGGGIYEPRAFYDACDELGIMVWQDFMFACATYPEEAPYPALVEAEARHQVARLSPHPSVVLWCGGNENTVAYESWGWKERLAPGQTWGERYWLETLPAILVELDSTRPYWPDSPYSGTRAVHPNDPDHGDRHTWDARVEGYRDLVPRFVSEFGHQAPPCWATWQAAVGNDGCVIDGAASRHRQRAGGGNAKQYDEPLAGHFTAPVDFDEWHYLAQLLQVRAIALAVEWLRAHRPRCMGALFWQLNDVWAGHSWSAIDSGYRRKPLWYAVRRAFAPRLLTIQPDGDGRVLHAVNDFGQLWSETAHVRRIAFDGEELATADVPIAVGGGASCVVTNLTDVVGPPSDPRGELIVATAGAARALWFHRRDRELALPPPRFDAQLLPAEDGITLRVHAQSLLRDVVLGVDRLDPAAGVDEHVVTLLPGETFDFRIRTTRPLALPDLISPPVFACVGGRGGG